MRRYHAAARVAAVVLAGACLGSSPARPAPAVEGPTTPETTTGGAEAPSQETAPSASLPFHFRGEFAAGWEILAGDRKSSKFNEYREVPNGLYLRKFLLIGESKDNTRFVELRGANFRQRDEFAQIRLGKYGGQQLMATFDRIPHNFSNTGRLLFHEVGPGLFTLPAQVRTDLGAISTTDINATTPGVQINTTAFGDIVNGLVHPIDLELQRRKTVLSWLGNFSPDLSAVVSYDHENYRGQRPIGTTFAFTNSNELPEPMDYSTNAVRAGLNYGWGRGAFSLELSHSKFNNPNNSLTWDNPLQTTDTTTSSARGRMSLPPDNKATDVSLSGAVHLSSIATISGVLSHGSWRQDDAFLPYTINSAIAQPALPASSLNGKIDTSLVDLALHLAPYPFLSARAFYRDYQNDNKTPVLTLPGSVLTDTTLETEASDTRPNGYQRRNFGIDADVNVARNLSVGLLAEQETWHRQFRDVAKTRENRFGISTNYRVGSWLVTRGSLRTGERRIRGDYVPDPDQLPELRKFDEADRDRNEAQLLLQISPPASRWDGSLAYTRSHNKYPRSLFGLTRADTDTFSLDVAYALSDRTSLYAGWVPERIVYAMNSRFRPVAAGTSEPVDNPLNDWSSTMSDHVQTVWLGVNHTLVPDKLDVGFSLSSSVGKGRISSFGVPGGDAAGQPPALPDTRYSLVEPGVEVNYHASPALTTAFAYRLERYRERDFAQDFMEPYMPQTDAPLSTFLGARQPGYTAHIFTFEIRHSF